MCHAEKERKVQTAEDIASNIFHPPLTIKDLKRGTWIAKRTGDPKHLPKLK
jgi:hypothetical protein